MIIGKNKIEVNFNKPLDISIPLRSGNNNPNCYHSESPVFTPITQGDFIGSVSLAGPCNHQRIELSPHGNGTHTECYGHLSDDATISINKCMTRYHFSARLVTIEPIEENGGDLVVSWERLRDKLGPEPPESVIIRTLPNDDNKLAKHYSGTNPAYLEVILAQQLAQMGVLHLLVDLPSIDREEDGGRLEAHHAFWEFPENPRKECTITELIYVPNKIPDGDYVLNLQIISLESDASPSKPVLYTVTNDFKQILK
jgi:kynurenine formamidase